MFVLKGIGRRTRITKYVAQDGTPVASGYGFAYTTDLQKARVFPDSLSALAHVQTVVDNTNKRNTSLYLVEVEVVPPTAAQTREIRAI